MDGRFEPSFRTLLAAAGAVFLLVALFWPFLSRWMGRLPGDVVVRRGSWTLAFPIVTCLLLSLLVSLVLWLFRR